MTVPVIQEVQYSEEFNDADDYDVGLDALSISSGNLLLMLIGNDGPFFTDQFTNNVSGWNFGFDVGDNVSDCHAAFYWRIADETEGASVSVSPNNADLKWDAWVLRITGHDPTTPINASQATNFTNTSTSRPIAEVTTTVAD